MHPHPHPARVLFVSALTVLAALVLPSVASAGPHHLELYKAEKQVDLEHDWSHEGFEVSCNAGDYAVDGMWRVDHVDQDDDYTAREQTTKIHPIWSYNKSVTGADGDQDTWTINFEKHDVGRAQLKIFVTCLGDRTADNGHKHGFVFGGRRTYNIPTSGSDSYAEFNHDNPCPSGYLAVAPGFEWNGGTTDPDDDAYGPGLHGSVFKWTWDDTSSPVRWRAGFHRKDGSDLDVFQHCLRVKTFKQYTPAGTLVTTTHVHKIRAKVRETVKSVAATATTDRYTEVSTSCRSHEKGMVGGFWFGVGDFQNGFWYAGMDPRIKKRAYRFVNPLGVANGVNLYLLCFNDRTG